MVIMYEGGWMPQDLGAEKGSLLLQGSPGHHLYLMGLVWGEVHPTNALCQRQ